MPKSTRNNKSRRPRGRGGNGNKNARRALAYALSFVVVLILGLYGLYQIKKYIPPDDRAQPVTAEKMSGLVKEADRIIAGAFFDLGISAKDIESKRTSKRSGDGIKWESRVITVGTPGGVDGKEIKGVFKKSFAAEKSYELTFKGSGDALTAELKALGFKTHVIKFEPPSKEAPPAKVVKKAADGTGKETEVKEPQGAREPGKTDEAVGKGESADSGAFEPKIAIIVDDIGTNKGPIDKLIELPAPVTLAVLPNLPYSRYAAEAARNKGLDVMLHLPMEPMESSGYTGSDAGEDALLVGLPKEAVLAKLDKNLSSVPYIKGVNNHMGSKFMENQELMDMVLEEIDGRGLFFIDSMTSSGSVGYKTALMMGMKTGKRDVFLDDSSKDAAYVKSQIEKLVRIAEKNGYAVGICHPYPGTVEALTEMIPQIDSRVEIVPVSSILTGGGEVSER
ncbi:MAG: hypothetical protein A3J42_07560 [Candidatus Dadabacteria bacterium RIFCSPHIGHO2_12_FULL_53_21]|nr:MAG: hypothetical protein A3J42_07560 [Candidatus Dadabacteria bacterium RIFCSPHIGHO2_12_FULL_53_21]